MTQIDRIREHLQTVKESHFFNILVIASHHTSQLILSEARTWGLLSRRYFWLLVLPDAGCSQVVELAAGNESNVLLIQPAPAGPGADTFCSQPSKICTHVSKAPDQLDASVIARSIESLVRPSTDHEIQETTSEAQSSICQNRRKDSSSWPIFLNKYSKITIPDARDGQAANGSAGHQYDTSYSICSTEAGQPSGMTSVGRWSLKAGLELNEKNGQLYRNTFRDFGFRTLRVATQEAKPFVQMKKDKKTFEGFCVDILEELAQKLRFKYEFVEPPDGQWGAPAENGSNWTGIVGMVMRKEVDMGVGPITITSIREAVIDFTKPFMEDGVGILTKRPNSDAKNMFKMFTPLTPQVWGAVAGAVVVVSLCLYGIERSSPFSARNLSGDKKLGLLGSAWLIYGSYMEQGGDPHPRSVSARCLVGFWWLFTILMTSTYTANLAAFLTVTIQDSPVNSLNELALSSAHKPLVKTGSNIHTLFMEADDGIYQDIWSRMSTMPKVTSNDAALSHVTAGSHAYMTDASQLEYIMLKDCTTFSLAKEIFNTGGFGFVLQEDAPYMEAINYNIMKMQEAGLVDKWRQKWWSSPDACATADRTSTAKKLDWPSLSGLFYIFLGVASAAVFLRVIEFWLQGEKISQFCFRLKSMVRQAASKSTESGDITPANTSTARHYSVNGRPPIRSEDGGGCNRYYCRDPDGETVVSDAGRDDDRPSVQWWSGEGSTVTSVRASLDACSDHRKTRDVSGGKHPEENNP